MQFKDVIGQEKAKQQLRLSVMEGKIPHAQLFTGPVGGGKLPLALAYAQYINCPNRTAEDSCGVCPTCLQYARMEHPDLHFAFPVTKNGDKDVVCDDYANEFRQMVIANPYSTLTDWYKVLGVENKQGLIYEKESSEILRKLSLKAFGNGYKIMIIWQADKMHTTCANKLLKILEEPPQKTLFLLITEQPELLLSTITSRTQLVPVPMLDARSQIQDDELSQKYLNDFMSLMRNAWKVAHLKDYQALQDLRQWSMDVAETKVGREYQKAFLQYAQRQLRENYIANFGLPELNYQNESEATFTKNFARFIHPNNVEQMMAELDKAEQQITQNGNAKIIFFDLCLQMIVLIKKTK